MSKLNLFFAVIATALLLAACPGTQVRPDETPDEVKEEGGQYVVTFRGRSIDLEPYVQGFPYSGFTADVEHRHLLYFETTPEGQWLYYQPLNTSTELDVESGKRLTSIDWSTRNFWASWYHPLSGTFLIYGDESMAEDYLNSGSRLLANAGREWARAHGYNVSTGFGSHRATWGDF